MRHDERLLITEHNSNRLKRLGMHQVFDLVGDHRVEVSRLRDEGKMETANDEMELPGRTRRVERSPRLGSESGCSRQR